jgi:gamma-glutamylcyclotransferase (GGCT)/AIG2-like uncharacterized protein YtfP
MTILSLKNNIRLVPSPKKSKYGNKKVDVGDLRFDSKREAARYGELLLRARIGEIEAIETQPRYPIVVEGKKIATYVADFRYRLRATGETVVEDVKGVRTAVYRIKKKLVEALYEIEIVEIL